MPPCFAKQKSEPLRRGEEFASLFCCEVKIHVKDYNKQICRLQLIIKVFPPECDLYGKIIENAAIESLRRTNGYDSRTRVYKI